MKRFKLIKGGKVEGGGNDNELEISVERSFAEDIVDLFDSYLADPSVMERVLFTPSLKKSCLAYLSELREVIAPYREFDQREALRLICCLYYTCAVPFRSFIVSEHRRKAMEIVREQDLIDEWSATIEPCDELHLLPRKDDHFEYEED